MSLPPFVSWASISLLHNVVRTFQFLHEREQQPLPRVLYRAKVKLHGTNAGIQSTPQGVFAQSRSKLLVDGTDNKGFAAWVRANQELFESLPVNTVVFGEWCGPGVEKGMAISALDRKVFCVFAIQTGVGEEAVLEVEPERLRSALPEHPELFVLPWHGAPIAIDFSNSLDDVVTDINRQIDAIEACDPWVKATFGIDGLGEGLVFYPDEAPLRPDRFALQAFKAKGEKHRTVASKKAAQATPDVAASVDDFVTLVVTEARLQQGVTEACGGTHSLASIGAFIRWVAADVQKECAAELEAPGLSWKQVARGVTDRARRWYKELCDR